MAPKVNCRFSEHAQLLLDGRLPAEQEHEFRLHLEECPTCRGELSRLESVRKLLCDAASAPPPPCDRQALEAAVLGSPPARRFRWWIPALGTAMAAAAMLLWFLLPGGVRPPALPEPPPIPQVPIPAPARQVLVSYSGSFMEPAAAEQTLPAVAFGEEIQAGPVAPLALRPAERISLVLWPGARIRLQERPDRSIELQLLSGECTLRRLPGAVPLRIQTGAVALWTVGTVLHVSMDAQGTATAELLEGELQEEDETSSARRLTAPVATSWSAGRRQPDRAPSSRAAEAVRFSKILDPATPGELGWVQVSSSPPGAEVWLEDNRLGLAPVLISRSDGEALELRLRAEGRREARAHVRIEGGRVLRQHLTLEPLPEPPPPAPRPPEDALARARTLLAAHEAEAAVALLEGRLRSRPGDVELRLLLADALRLSRRPEQALDHYRQVARTSRDPHVLEVALFEASRIELDVLNQPARALETLLAARRILPQGLLRQEVAFRLAECYLKLSDFGRAVRALQDYLRLYPQGTRAAEAQRLLSDLAEKGWR